jgi:Type IV secretion system pilin
MINKIKTTVMALSLLFAFAAPVVVATPSASAACSSIANKVSEGANGAATGNNSNDCGTGNGVDNNSIARAANGIVNIFSLIVGIVAVIMIIYGGFRYITSGGDSGKVGNAKNSLIYAVVGLIVVAMAQLIVRFVLTQSASLTT